MMVSTSTTDSLISITPSPDSADPEARDAAASRPEGAGEPPEGWGSLVGGSAAMRRLFALVPRIAAAGSSVLITGETGTGKSVLARAIHDASPRAGKPFVVVDCASIPPTLIEAVLFGHDRGAFTGAHVARPGAFEAARGGTVFLDEIGELPLELQPKLLRALEARQVQRIGEVAPTPIDVRILAATHRDLSELARRGAFRADLLYRIQVVTVAMPALRERRADIPALAAQFYRELTAGGDPPPELLRALAGRDWPGNVRELRNAIERSVVLGAAGDLGAGEARGDQGQRSDRSEGAARRARGTEELRTVRSARDERAAAAARRAGDAGGGGTGPGGSDPAGGGPGGGAEDDDDGAFALAAGPFDPAIAFRDAKADAIARWERWYIRELLRHTGGNLSHAARLAQSDRAHLRKLAQRHAAPRRRRAPDAP